MGVYLRCRSYFDIRNDPGGRVHCRCPAIHDECTACRPAPIRNPEWKETRGKKYWKESASSISDAMSRGRRHRKHAADDAGPPRPRLRLAARDRAGHHPDRVIRVRRASGGRAPRRVRRRRVARLSGAVASRADRRIAGRLVAHAAVDRSPHAEGGEHADAILAETGHRPAQISVLRQQRAIRPATAREAKRARAASRPNQGSQSTSASMKVSVLAAAFSSGINRRRIVAASGFSSTAPKFSAISVRERPT